MVGGEGAGPFTVLTPMKPYFFQCLETKACRVTRFKFLKYQLFEKWYLSQMRGVSERSKIVIFCICYSSKHIFFKKPLLFRIEKALSLKNRPK